jgi:hypothetical protein
MLVFGSGLTGFLIVSPRMMNLQSNSAFSIYYGESLYENDVLIRKPAISKIVQDYSTMITPSRTSSSLSGTKAKGYKAPVWVISQTE